MSDYRFVMKTRSDGQWMFNLVAGNGEVVATSEGYHNREDALHTIHRIMQMVPDAKIADES